MLASTAVLIHVWIVWRLGWLQQRAAAVVQALWSFFWVEVQSRSVEIPVSQWTDAVLSLQVALTLLLASHHAGTGVPTPTGRVYKYTDIARSVGGWRVVLEPLLRGTHGLVVWCLQGQEVAGVRQERVMMGPLNTERWDTLSLLILNTSALLLTVLQVGLLCPSIQVSIRYCCSALDARTLYQPVSNQQDISELSGQAGRSMCLGRANVRAMTVWQVVGGLLTLLFSISLYGILITEYQHMCDTTDSSWTAVSPPSPLSTNVWWTSLYILLQHTLPLSTVFVTGYFHPTAPVRPFTAAELDFQSSVRARPHGGEAPVHPHHLPTASSGGSAGAKPPRVGAFDAAFED